MNGTKYAPGAARPDLEAVLIRHRSAAHGAFLREVEQAFRRDLAAAHRAWACASLHALWPVEVTHPENFYATGTDLRADLHPCQLDASADDAERILRNHRRMAHRAWVRSVEDGDEAGAVRAWMCARAYAGLPT